MVRAGWETAPKFDFRGRDASYLAPPAQIRTSRAFFVKGASRHFGRPLHSILLFDPRRELLSVPTAYFHRRRAQRRSRTALLQRRRAPQRTRAPEQSQADRLLLTQSAP